MQAPLEKPVMNGFDHASKNTVKLEIDESTNGQDSKRTAPLSRSSSFASVTDASKSTLNPRTASGTIAPSETTNGSDTNGAKPAPPHGSSRINIDTVMAKFQRRLGRHWDKYRDTITQFLMGKLSRQELTAVLNSSFMGPKEIHLHNYLLLSILANSFRDLPPGEESLLTGWKQSKGSSKRMTDTPTELLHREILALPARERKRIKNITRDSAKRPAVSVPPPAIIATRQALLPKIPYVQDKTTGVAGQRGAKGNDRSQTPGRASPGLDPRQASLRQSASSTLQNTVAARQAAKTLPEEIAAIDTQAIETLDGLPVHPGKFSGPLMWAQDIIHGLDTQLASESYEIPEDETLGTRMLGIALEHGMIRGIEAGTTDIMLRGLESYLTSIVSRMVHSVRNSDDNSTRVLNAADLDKFTDAHASEFHEISPPLYRLKTQYLRDEGTVPETVEKIQYTHVDPQADPEDGAILMAAADEPAPKIRKTHGEEIPGNYLDLVAHPPTRNVSSAVEAALENANQGRELILSLLS